MTDLMDGSYHAEGLVVRKRPIRTPRPGGGCTVEIGFPVCEAHECVGEPGATEIVKALNFANEYGEVRPLVAWHEDVGDVLWWRFPIEEPPYVGGPLDTDWPGYHTHWSKIPVPQLPEGGL